MGEAPKLPPQRGCHRHHHHHSRECCSIVSCKTNAVSSTAASSEVRVQRSVHSSHEDAVSNCSRPLRTFCVPVAPLLLAPLSLVGPVVATTALLVLLLLPGCPGAVASPTTSTGSASSSSSADLCFLSHGGSSETFTVNEAIPANSVIGSLKVIGNVSSGDRTLGDIELSLAPNHPKSRLEGQEVPIRIEPHTKNLILVRALDKEGPEGEQGVVVGVKCRRVNQLNEPSIIIPVRLIVTDANDHHPTFVGSLPYVGSVSEVSPVGSLLLPPDTIRAEDDDQQGPFSTIEYYVEPGPFSHMAKFESQFGGNLILTAPLDYETLPKFWLVIKAQDQGEPPNSASATVTINVLDADDQNPRFSDDKYTATLPELNRPGEQLTVSPRPVRASDPDMAINSAIEFGFSLASDTREYAYFTIDPKFGGVSLKKSLPPSVDLPLTLVIRATQLDNRDRYALTTLTVFNRRHLSLPDVRFLQSNYSATLLENIPPGHVALTVQTTRLDKGTGDKGDSVTSFQILDDEEGHFGIRSNGEITVDKALDFEAHKWYSFRVMVSDGKQSDVTRVNITVLNVNDHDPQFSQAHYSFFVSETRLRSNSVVGEVRATDADTGDKVTLTIRGPFAKVFSMSEDGILKVKSLKSLNTSQCHLIVVATDSGLPPRSSSVPVTVQFAPGLLKSFGRSLDELEKFGLERGGGGGPGGVVGADVDVNMLLSASSSSAIVLVIVLGVLLATLFIIIITLTVHVLKQRKFAGARGSNGGSTSSSEGSGSGSASPNHHPYHQQQQQQYQFQGPSRHSSTISSSLTSKAARLGSGLSDGGGGQHGVASSFNPPIVPGLGSRGVENPIFNLGGSGASTTSNLSSRYYSTPLSASTGGLGLPAKNACSDPDSAIVSDASSSDNHHQQHHHQQHHQQHHHHQKNGGSEGSQEDEGSLSGRPGSRHSSQGSSSVSPPPPPSVTCTGLGGVPTLSSGGCGGGAGGGNTSRISFVKWPQGSIPRRVKKLTWEDEIGGYRTAVSSALCQSQGQHLGSHQGDASEATGTTGVSSSSGSQGLVAIKTNLGLGLGHGLGTTTLLDTTSAGLGRFSGTSTTGGLGGGSSGMPSVGASSPVFRHTELDPDVSVAPLRRTLHHQNSSSSGLPDLTVYF